MIIKYDDMENAFLFVSMQPPFTNTAILCKETGEIYYESGYGDSDELPEDIDDEKYIGIPHKNDLDVGRNLVFEFVSQYMQDDQEKVYDIFRRKGACSRYKHLLEKRGLLEKWYDYENKRTKEALLSWCAENNIEIKG